MKLEPFTESDIDRLLGWLPDDPGFLVQWAGPGYRFPLDREQLVDHLRDAPPNRRVFRAVDDASGEVVGHAEIGHIDRARGVGRVGRVLIGRSAARGKGAGTRLLEAVAEYAFEGIGLVRLELGVYDFNTPAIRCYTRVGFVSDGTQDRIRVGNETWTSIQMVLERGAWALRRSIG